MVLAPFMFRYLSESEYEHMAKCATDVVQWRADEAVFLGAARALGDGNLLPRPSVHFRDGTITPQEREYGHYRRWNEYGEMVRDFAKNVASQALGTVLAAAVIYLGGVAIGEIRNVRAATIISVGLIIASVTFVFSLLYRDNVVAYRKDPVRRDVINADMRLAREMLRKRRERIRKRFSPRKNDTGA